MAEHHPLVVVAARPKTPGIVPKVAESRKGGVEEWRQRVRTGAGVTRDELQIRPVPFCGKTHDVIESRVFRRRLDEGGLLKIVHELVGPGFQRLLPPFRQFALRRNSGSHPDPFTGHTLVLSAFQITKPVW